ncbi:MAG TPA: ribbon-helix-helix protein, CopG family [Bacteroidota bacterium]
MTTTITAKIDRGVAKKLTRLAKDRKQTKSRLVEEALEDFLEQNADYSEALRRLNDKDQRLYTVSDARKRLGI